MLPLLQHEELLYDEKVGDLVKNNNWMLTT